VVGSPPVLVVEHDAALREVLERVLHRTGFAPVTAPSGAEVTCAAHERLPPGMVADAVLRKPIDLDQLIACLWTLCEAAFA
jgi:DNA-binding NtrC family response regulator